MFVRNHMSANPITVQPDDSINYAGTLMKEYGIRHLPVVSEGQLVGVVTQTDIFKVSASPATSLSIWELNYLIAKLAVKDAMTARVISVQEEAPVEEAALLMRQNKIGSLPVLNSTGKLVGIITETDLFDAILDAMGSNTATTRVVIECDDRPGELSRITGVIAEYGINIWSLVVFHPAEGIAHVVVRLQGENLEGVFEKLASEDLRLVR
ncbi:MAG: CBS domain-containing protein [Clostridia bacterium]|nr:MAG: CBS domain-containing protein [Clostridia bacterium]